MGRRFGMRSGTSSLRETRPDPMPAADRDGQPYLEDRLGQHAVLPLPVAE
jgi:hypothetical protein